MADDENHDRTDAPGATLSRRRLLHGLGAALAAVPVSNLLACSSGNSASTSARDPSTSGGGDGGTSAANDSGIASANVPWATGGTKAMTGNYPDPFASGLGTTCTLYCAATLGPCHAETVARKDISEGEPGLPTRLVFLVVDESCTPIEGASVDIWHCGPDGLYSGSDAIDFCTSGDPRARAARWYRGMQKTDARGRVDFDTCFPGWYRGRTIHVHFTVRIGDEEHVTSQLVFDDALDDEIVSTQPLYGTRGARDTRNTNDSIVGGSKIPDYTFQTARMPDGVLLAWKALVVRRSLATSLCQAEGAGRAGMPGAR